MSRVGSLPDCMVEFFDAVNQRDAERAGEALTLDATYHLIMPHPPVEGREAIVAALRSSLTEADKVQWDIVAWGSHDDVVFVERVDRFFYGEKEAAIECMGAFTMRDGRIHAIRDYADLATWRQRKATAQT